MPSEPMILQAHFYHAKGRGKHSLQSGAHHADYMADPEKDELLVDDRTTLESAAIHAKYADERDGSMGSFGTVGTKEAVREIGRHTQAPVWRFIVSVGEADALAMGNGLTTKAGWERATREAMPGVIRAMGLDPAKVAWDAAAHRQQAQGERNPHIHLLLWEKGSPTRRTGKLQLEEIAKVRRAFASVLYRPELERVGQAKAQARTASKSLTQAILNKSAGPMELEQRFVNELTDRLTTLGESIPAKGRLAYKYLPPTAKTEVMDLAHWLSDTHPALKDAKTAFLDAAATYASVHWSPLGDTEWGGAEQAKKRQQALDQARAKADQDFHQRLVPDILKAAVRHRPGTPDLEPGEAFADRQAEHAVAPEIRHALNAAWAQESVQTALRQAVRTIRANPDSRGTAIATAVTAIQNDANPALKTPEGERALTGRVQRRVDASLAWHTEHGQIRQTVLASAKLRRQIANDPASAVDALKTARPDLSAKKLAQHAEIIAEELRRQSARHRTQTSRILLQSLFRGLSSHAHEAQYAAYLSAKDQWERKRAELELAHAQGMDIAL